MDKHEIALQLTLKALEDEKHCFITPQSYAYNSQETAEEQNAFNAKQISDFYNAILNAIQ